MQADQLSAPISEGAAGTAGGPSAPAIRGRGIDTTRLLSLSEDLPIAVIIIDQEDRVRDFLPQLDELVSEGLVIIDPVEVIRYVGRSARGAS